VNNVVLRADLSGNPTFRELLGRVREVTLEAYMHQDVPFDAVVDKLQPERDLSRNPLFQVMFSFHDSPLLDLKLPELAIDLHEGLNNGSAKFDLNIVAIPRSEQRVGLSPKAGADGIDIIWEYNTDLFDDTTISRMIEHYQVLLQGIVADPEQRLAALPLLTEAEHQQLLVAWNDTQTDYPRNACIQHLFEAQVEQTPQAIAVSFNNEQLTYSQLNRRANQLAHHLQAQGVGPEVCVGLCLERSLEMIVGILGILKAGGAYVPLDPEYPQERLRFMLSDTQAPLLLTQQRLVSELPEQQGRVICLDTDWAAVDQESDTNPSSQATAESLAYVMYTSGSTGRPKGTCISHRNVVRLVQNTNYAELSASEVILQFAPISFDAATLEIWGALLNGGRLVVFPAHKPTLAELGEVIQQNQVTTLWLTAGLFQQMVDDHLESLKSVHQLLAGGDVLSVPHVLKVLQELDGCTLINGYGPTENTTFTTCYPMTDPNQVGTNVSIGRPIAQTQVYILDRQLQPVPIGVRGELYIGGDGLARSYLNRPELTAEKFIPNPFSAEPGARLYKTGDAARYLADGNIEFLGRLDDQVKIRGFRVELGEIETVLGQHPGVQKNVILAQADSAGSKRLVAYVVPSREPAPPSSEWRKYLKQKLPGYMIPTTFVTMAKLPLNPNGKVDRQALPAPAKARPDLGEGTFVAPRTKVEEVVAGICAEVLELERIGIYDNFFELGGHSLLAMQVISRLGEAFQMELSLRSLFEAPTVAGLAKHVETIRQTVQNLRASASAPGGDREEIEL
jgi:aspartate racemase